MKAVVGCFAGIAFPGEGGVRGIDVFAVVVIVGDNEFIEPLVVVKLCSIVEEEK